MKKEKIKRSIIYFLLILILLFLIGISANPQLDTESIIYLIIKENNSTTLIINEQNFIQGSHLSIDSNNLDNYQIMDFNGYSMQPTIFSGNKLLIEKWDKIKPLEEGMIIVFNHNHQLKAHRIKAIYPASNIIITQGDNMAPFEEIKPEDINFIVVGVLYT